MSLDRSLKIKSSLVRHRNVLSRAERIDLLKSQDRWKDEMTPLGLPKVANRKLATGKKKTKAEKAGEEGAAGAAAPPAAK